MLIGGRVGDDEYRVSTVIWVAMVTFLLTYTSVWLLALGQIVLGPRHGKWAQRERELSVASVSC